MQQDLRARRVVTRHPEARAEERWHGHVESATAPPLNRWRGASVGEVVESMNRDLSPVPDSQYSVVES